MIRKSTLFFLIPLSFLAMLTASCNKFEGTQTVPAYIRIDTMGLSCDYSIYGANTHNFVDAWVYVDDNILGCFELPATFPVLKEGKHKVTIKPGIKVDGIASRRSYYPFMKDVIYEEVNLVKDSVVTLFPVFNYLPNGDNLHVRWKEDFDGGALMLQPTSTSDTGIIRATGPLAWHDPQGIYSTYSGKLVLTSDTSVFCVASTEEFTDLPATGSACMLEMDYKCTDSVLVGLYYLKDYTITEYPIIRLRPTDPSGEEPVHWNKIYINIGPYIVENEDADYFKLYLSSWPLRKDGTQYFYFDNLKIIYRDR